ncbi:hypothetical protein [Sphingomicrobium lutaoense]|uniref:Sugar transporter n=1 Tax=Sphingomicrobium lutaoense TaxID=515949 RepID=A0A839Z1R7_9SPHN|nr:hypothetical protein [Sphingomicrobium lutaoense]MBB3764508.1 hypothetical protein [Sphingomicrobium lutaoense]
MERSKAPTHLWIVGIVSLLWNAYGAFDYLMTRTRNEAYLSALPVDYDELMEYIDSFPLVADIGWGLGVWGAVLGSVLLLLRSRYAVHSFAVSLVGAVVSLGYDMFMADKPEGMSGGIFDIMPIVIILIAVALLYYARRQAAAGVLR